jgi:hypothetical protein
MGKLYKIGEAAKKLGVSIQTLRRWAKDGSLEPDFVSPGGHRFYSEGLINRTLTSLTQTARAWVLPGTPPELTSEFYCENSAVFLTRLNRFSQELLVRKTMVEAGPLVVAIAGEIGNNSFDHNLGNWPDMPGIFFGYNINRREVVLADRGQGVLRTLQRVRSSLKTEEEAVRVAFTESISGRAPEKRGNGLKFVRKFVKERGSFGLVFISNTAELSIDMLDKRMEIHPVPEPIHGTLVVLHF